MSVLAAFLIVFISIVLLIVLLVVLVKKLIKQKKQNKSWFGKNEAEMIRDDGHVIYKTNWVNSIEKSLVGFYGQKRFSKNNEYCVVYQSAGNEDEKGRMALINCNKNNILYKTTTVKRPHKCDVSNNGIVICCDWKGWRDISSTLWCFNNDGQVLFKLNYRQSTGDTCIINKSGTIAVVDVCKSWEYHIIDIKNKKIIKRIKEYTTSSHVDIEKREIVLCYDDAENKTVKF